VVVRVDVAVALPVGVAVDVAVGVEVISPMSRSGKATKAPPVKFSPTTLDPGLDV
jgi:hypothetical protein